MRATAIALAAGILAAGPALADGSWSREGLRLRMSDLANCAN